MQVDPIQSTLKAPRIKLLKLEYDEPLSDFAFEFNLRCYIWERVIVRLDGGAEVSVKQDNCDPIGS
jgi:hypothetical protein